MYFLGPPGTPGEGVPGRAGDRGEPGRPGVFSYFYLRANQRQFDIFQVLQDIKDYLDHKVLQVTASSAIITPKITNKCMQLMFRQEMRETRKDAKLNCIDTVLRNWLFYNTANLNINNIFFVDVFTVNKILYFFVFSFTIFL